MMHLIIKVIRGHIKTMALYIMIYLSCILSFFKAFDIINFKWWVVAVPLIITIMLSQYMWLGQRTQQCKKRNKH